MISGLTSVVIPTHNHVAFVAEAIDSALAQTADVEVVVIDDGSTDETAAVLARYSNDARVRTLSQEHAGPSIARNAGIEAARGEFIMFLDADDVVAPNKVAEQLAAMTPEIGFVLCDVLIEDVRGAAQLASERYDYGAKELGGWIGHHLAVANFIPNMAPLIRREALGDIRFHSNREPEDWHFIHSLAQVARCRYVPEVLATYRKRLSGRNTKRPRAPWLRPGVEPPTRLNLGCGTPNTRSWHPMPGFVNMDRSLGWRFEDGLGDFVDGSVAGITISHALMYVELAAWPGVFAEFARVLQPGGVLRITEDDASNPASSRFGGWRGSQPAVTNTDAALVHRFMQMAGFTVHDVTADATRYGDRSLLQAQHGEAPDVFFIEGIRECTLLFEPHADDAVLFSAFAVIRHRPRVIVCYPSSGDYGDTEARTAESRRAMSILGGGPVEQWDGTEIEDKMREIDARVRPTRVWAPSVATSHPDHLAVAIAAAAVFGSRLTRYQTYDLNAGGKVRAGNPVPFEPGWAEMKKRALACYATQLAHPRSRAFFEYDLAEYEAL